MNKTVKALVIAASVAAVVGVGAVSFAKWEAGAKNDQAATGTLGQITAYGFDSELSETISNLMPYDQGDGTCVWSFALPNVTAAPATKLTAKLTSDPGLDANSGIYVKWSESNVSTAPDDTTGYKKLTTSAQDLDKTFAANSESASAGYLVVIVDSSKLGDMGKSFSITVSVATQA